ncbi:uracil-DNA glycosylase [Ferrimonas lipolytica]|uniref:Uracil-DNA glycosylase n=1 Tax=Ferrimonas lipolytica TaxID=2724191 RepID=A0A6H1UEM1_9GAMM|nr:uracil-DNA glycosylase [Ferrimonas lipolytica]QIZ77531.1 uracil-DNA glycosylase [Ferrimonas lipolytica]
MSCSNAFSSQWQPLMLQQQQQPYYQQMMAQIELWRQQGQVIYPPQQQIFAAFEHTPLAKVKVVILGQDPYHGAGQAHGLSFSVEPGIKVPPSLVNIYKELAQDIDGFTIPSHGDLRHWAEQGVLLLNTVLTVEQGKAHSHAKIGWEQFTDEVIRNLASEREGLVFMLWGSHAQKKGKGIDRTRHTVLVGPHPSPLSAYRGFFGCGHFSQANRQLLAQGQSAINWQL